jgi:DNA polymerase elongation subunit (family B)
MFILSNQYEDTKDSLLADQISILDNAQQAFKVCCNEGYGVLANKYYRWFSFNNAEAITLSGQLTIKWAAHHIDEYFNTLLGTNGIEYVYYSDTDSLCLNLEKLVEKVMPDEKIERKRIEFLQKMVSERLDKFLASKYEDLAKRMHAYENHMHMKLDSISNRFICLGAKTYLMNVYVQEKVFYKEPKIKVKGFQGIKTNTPKICRDRFKKTFDIIMNKSEKELQDYVTEFKTEFNTLDFYSIASPSGINNMIKYAKIGNSFASKTPFQVRGALVYNEQLEKQNLTQKYEKITDGDKARICYLKEPNIFRSNVIAAHTELPKEFNAEEYIDYDTQFHKSFIVPLNKILDVIGWKVEKTNTLENFFA